MQRRIQPELELQTPDEPLEVQPDQPKQPDAPQNPDEGKSYVPVPVCVRGLCGCRRDFARVLTRLIEFGCGIWGFEDLLQPEPPESKTPEKPAERSASHEQCSSLATEYKVRTVQDLANLPFEVQPTWARNRCAEELALPLVPPQNTLPQELDTAECVSLKEKFGVVGRIIDGLPVSLRDAWLTSRCPQKIKELENPANGESPDAPQEPQEPSKAVDTDTTPETAAAAVEIATTNGFNPQYATRCKELMDKFKIRPGITWGNMHSEAMRNQWQAMRCDDWYWALAAVMSWMRS